MAAPHRNDDNITAWLREHCYDCGGRIDEDGPRDADHILCFVGLDDLTQEQRDQLTLIYTVEPLPMWRQHGFPSLLDWVWATAG